MTEETTRPLAQEERDKLVAEANRIKLDMEKLTVDIEIAKADLSVKQSEAREASAKAELIELEKNLKTMSTDEALASNRYNHIYRFNDEVNSATVEHCMDRLNIWHRTSPGCDIEIIFNSEGGSANSGLELYDYLQDLKRPWTDDKGNSYPGHKITTGARGLAASMAGLLLQAGDVRWIGRHASMLIHEPAARNVGGKYNEMMDTMEWVKTLSEMGLDIYMDGIQRAITNGTATKPLDRDQISKNWTRRDWYVWANECLESGLVDKVCG